MTIRPQVIFAACAALLLCSGTALFAAPDNATTDDSKIPVERFALYIASNDGGDGLERLRYARSDAKHLAETMMEVGGVSQDNSLILVDPTIKEVNNAFSEFSTTIKKNANKARRTEFLFYYSGHSDENALRLGNETYAYGVLKAELNKVPSDVRVVMLDSCYSGNFVRSKGGSRQKPFLMDDSTIVQGNAYLSSSSEHEESQESDIIQASYFTQALITGLRGAADANSDSKVSLNELYYYAFNETLSKTESSSVGPQHPSYNITLVGSGDLVITDLSEAESVMNIPGVFEGKFFIRNTEGLLVSEINKAQGIETSLALPAGTYTIAIVTPSTTSQASQFLGKGQHITLNPKNFSVIARSTGRARGAPTAEGEAEGEIQTSETSTPVSLSFTPGLSIPLPMADNVNVGLGIFMADNHNIRGTQISSFMGSMSGDLYGAQTAGFMNTLSGMLTGVQAAGFMNLASQEVHGVQAAGFMNFANSEYDFTGVQTAGFLNNTNGNMRGGQAAGFLNDIKGDLIGVQYAGFLNNARGSLTGAQLSGFLNNVNSNFIGVQSTGFLNIARGSSKGVQASGFLNIADEITGAQVGFINIARKNNGVALGVFNFILDGIMSPAIYVDSNKNIYMQYQGGTNKFFTTWLVGTEMDASHPLFYDYLIYGFGVGTRFAVTKQISFDVELIAKQYIDISTLRAIKDMDPDHDIVIGSDEKTEANSMKPEVKARIDEWGNEYTRSQMPSVRATANYAVFKHLSAFASANLDCSIDGFNEKAFAYGNTGSAIKLGSSGIKLYPGLSIGLKF